MIRGAALLLVAALVAATPATAERRVLKPGEMRNLAVTALDARRPDVALDLTTALLERDPNDIQALLIRSRAARDGGNYALAKSAAQKAWSLGRGDKATRHAAALAMAQALSSQGQRTRAQIWLRRAAEAAPTPQAKAMAVRDFRYVRSRNRWSTQLQFNVAPKSNVNNGSANSTFTEYLFGQAYELPLPGAAQALSGVEFSLGANTRYRLAETTRSATDLTFAAQYTTYMLTDAARALAPTALGSDYALGSLTAGIAQKWLSPDARTEYRLGGSVGHSWYGGRAYGQHFDLTAGVGYAASKTTKLAFDGRAKITRGPRAPHSDALTLSAKITQKMANGAVFGLWGAGTKSRSSVNVAKYTDLSIGVSYAPDIALLGATPRFGLGLRKRDYPVSGFAPGFRDDLEQSAWLDLTFEKIDYFGFHPTVRVQASRTNSNISVFDINKSGVSFGITSAY